MKYQIISPNGYGRGCDSKSCLPSESMMKSMLDAGCKVIVDGKRITRAEVLKLVKENE